MSNFKMRSIYVGSWLTTVKYPKTEAPCVMMMAHTGAESSMAFHGTGMCWGSHGTKLAMRDKKTNADHKWDKRSLFAITPPVAAVFNRFAAVFYVKKSIFCYSD